MDVKTAGRTVELFELFARMQVPMTLSEIARALEAPQSSCFNLLRALEARGYLYSVGGGKRLYPTRKLFDIAEAIAELEPVVPRVVDVLEALRNESQETVIFGARQGNKAIYLSVIEGTQTIRYISRAGELKPLHASTIGKSLLMAMPADERAKLVRKLPLKEKTERTITNPETLLADLEAAHRRGYAMTKGEHVADVMAVGAPIQIDNMVYAVAIAGPMARMKPKADHHAALIHRLFDQFLEGRSRRGQP